MKMNIKFTNIKNMTVEFLRHTNLLLKDKRNDSNKTLKQGYNIK